MGGGGRENTGNLVFSSCKSPDFKGKRYCDICRKNFQISFEAGFRDDTFPTF